MNVNTCLILLFCFLTDIYETLSIVYLAAIISVILQWFNQSHLPLISSPAAPKFPHYINQKSGLVVTPVGNSTQILIMLPAVIIWWPTGIKIEGFTQLIKTRIEVQKSNLAASKENLIFANKCQKWLFSKQNEKCSFILGTVVERSNAQKKMAGKEATKWLFDVDFQSFFIDCK